MCVCTHNHFCVLRYIDFNQDIKEANFSFALAKDSSAPFQNNLGRLIKFLTCVISQWQPFKRHLSLRRVKNKIFTLGTADVGFLHRKGGRKTKSFIRRGKLSMIKAVLNLYALREKINQVVMAKIKNLKVHRGVNKEQREIACGTMLKRYASLIPALITLHCVGFNVNALLSIKLH